MSRHPLIQLTAPVGDDLLVAIAERVVPLLADRVPEPREPWIGSAAAAEHLATTIDRIHQLVHQRRIPYRKDGSRLLFRRSELDAYLTDGGGRDP